MITIQHVILCRTDNLGDVMLSLPMAGILKEKYPGIKISFIGKKYTQPLIIRSSYIDQFLDRDQIISGVVRLQDYQADAIIFVFPDQQLAHYARKAHIRLRIGTSHRWFHWLYCNRLVSLTRKTSNLHEAQLNLKLLAPLGVNGEFELAAIGRFYGIKKNLNGTSGRFILVVHPKSKGSAREWPLSSYANLIMSLPKDRFEVWVTGTATEGNKMEEEMPDFFEKTQAVNLTGKLSLDELIDKISSADALLACSTGPLHIAAALGIHAIGIYPPIKPMHPGRWAPIGDYVKIFCLPQDCNACRNTGRCACISSIEPKELESYIVSIANKNQK